MKSCETLENSHESDGNCALSQKVAAVIMEVSTPPNFLREGSKIDFSNSNKKSSVSTLKPEEVISIFNEVAREQTESNKFLTEIDGIKDKTNNFKEVSGSPKFYKFYKTLQLVQRFAAILKKSKRGKGKDSLIQNSNFGWEIILDKAFVPKMPKYHNFGNIQSICRIFNEKKILKLFIKYVAELLSFDLLLIILIVFNFIMIPLIEAFEIKNFEKQFWFLQAMLLFFSLFLYSLIQNARSHRNGIEIGSNEKSMFHYLQSYGFFYDLCCCAYFLIGIIYVYSESKGLQIAKNIAGLLFLFSVNVFKKKLSKLMYNFSIKYQFAGAFISLFSNILLFIHYGTCFLILIGRVQIEDEKGWLFRFLQTRENSNIETYVSAFYCIFCENNEINQKTLIEKIYFSAIRVLMIIFIIVNFNSIKQVWNYLIYRFSGESQQKFEIFKDYLSEKKVDYKKMIKIENYFKFASKEKQEQNFAYIQDHLKILPNPLKRGLFKNLKSFITKKISVMKYFSSLCLGELLNEMQQRNYKRDEVIFDSQTSSEPCVYFIDKGEINICIGNLKKNPIILGKFHESESFGEFYFFENIQPKYSIMAATNATVKYLTKSSFLKVLLMYPKEYEKYCNIKDEIVFNGSYGKFFHKCTYCKQNTHNSFECLSYFLQTLKNQILQPHIISNFQRRKHFSRSKTVKKYNTLMKKQNLQKVLSSMWSSNSHSHSNLDSSEEFEDYTQEVDTSEYISKQSDEISEIVIEPKNSETSIAEFLQKKKSVNLTNSLAKKSVFYHLNQNQKDKLAEKKTDTYEETLGNKEIEVLESSPFMEFNTSFEIDSIQEFKYYFNHGNLSQILEKRDRKGMKRKSKEKEMEKKIAKVNLKSKKIKSLDFLLNLVYHVKKRMNCFK